MNSILGLITLMRPVNMIMSAVSVISLGWFLNPSIKTIQVLIPGAFIVSLILAAGNIMNDILDINSDVVSKPKRFLAQKPHFKIYAIAYLLFILLTSILLIYVNGVFANYPLIFLGILTVSLLIIYNLYLKKILFIGNFTVGLCTTFIIPFTLLWLQLKNIPVKVDIRLWGYGTLIFLSHFSREISKSVADDAGDRKRQKKTYITAQLVPELKFLNYILLLCTIIVIALIIIHYYSMLSPVGIILLSFSACIFLGISIKIKNYANFCFKRQSEKWHKYAMISGLTSLLFWKI